jgi:hypothetical protein
MTRKAGGPWGQGKRSDRTMAQAGEHWLRSLSIREQETGRDDQEIPNVVRCNLTHSTLQTNRKYL